MSLLGKANESVELVKSALDAKIALATAEDKEKLADAKLALADLKELIANLKDEVQTLRQRLKAKDEFVLNKGVYWREEDGSLEQPYCPACYSKEKIMPLQKQWEGRRKDQSPWFCPEKSCNATYNPWDHKEEYNPRDWIDI